MKLEDLKQEILALSSEQKLQLMNEIGSALCEAIMNQPEAMKEMMPMCREMMSKRPEMMARMREMMMGETKE